MPCVRPVRSRLLRRPEDLAPVIGSGDGAGLAAHRVMVTRPADETGDWVHRLRSAGWPAEGLPLIRIGEPRSASALAVLRRHRAHWADFDALMFVSGAAVRHFFAGQPLPPATPDNRTRFWAPGPGTARVLASALPALGLTADRIDAPPADASQFDSEALWPVVAPQLRAGMRILIVRGASVADPSVATPAQGNGREWLIRQCEQAGVAVQTVAAYERHAPDWSAPERELLRQGLATGSIWLLSSSEALDHLLAAAPQGDWSGVSALVTHPRIAERARQAGFGRVVQSRPAFDDVVRALESGWSPP